MYEGIKMAAVPSPAKTAPLKPKDAVIITDQGKQLQRWVEHYLELYSTMSTVTDSALDAISNLPIMQELDTPHLLPLLSSAKP